MNDRSVGLFSPEPGLVQTIVESPWQQMRMTITWRIEFEEGSPIDSWFFYEGERLDEGTQKMLEIELWARNFANDVASLND